jgi:two-component system, NarL family, invasion response regulator UvrY
MSTRSCSPRLSRTAKLKPTKSLTAECHSFQFLIVDDHSLVRNGLTQILAKTYPGAGIAEARDAKTALAFVMQKRLDVVLLDISLPGQSGLDVLKQIKEVQPEAKILILTMHPEDQYPVRVLKAGASGYLTKDTASEEVAIAVKKILDGGTYVSAALAENLASNLHDPSQRLPHDRLSDREYQILRMIGIGKSVKEIAYELSLSIKTISTYRARVLAKLKFKGNADVIRYAMREKLVD